MASLWLVETIVFVTGLAILLAMWLAASLMLRPSRILKWIFALYLLIGVACAIFALDTMLTNGNVQRGSPTNINILGVALTLGSFLVLAEMWPLFLVFLATLVVTSGDHSENYVLGLLVVLLFPIAMMIAVSPILLLFGLTVARMSPSVWRHFRLPMPPRRPGSP